LIYLQNVRGLHGHCRLLLLHSAQEEGAGDGWTWPASDAAPGQGQRGMAEPARPAPVTVVNRPWAAAALAALRRSREASRGARGPRGRRPTAVGARHGSVGSGRRRKMAEHPEHVGDMVELAGKEKTKLGKASNGHGFAKRMTIRCRGRRELPRGGDGFRRRRPRWPKKLAEGSPET